MATINPEPPTNDQEGVELTALSNNSVAAKYTPSDGPPPDEPSAQPPAPDQVPGPDDKPDVEAPPAEDFAQKPSVLTKQSTVYLLDHNWTLSEGE